MARGTKANDVVCRWCGLPLHFDVGSCWVHPGGGLYLQKCNKCGRVVDTPKSLFICPCGGRMVDDHCAMPVRA